MQTALLLEDVKDEVHDPLGLLVSSDLKLLSNEQGENVG